MKITTAGRGLHYVKIFKGIFNAYLITIILFLIFATMLYFTNVTENIIPKAVTVLSAVSIVLGGVGVTRDIDRLGWLHGGLIGMLYVLILIALGLFINPNASYGISALIDVGMGFAVGVIAGIIGVNL